jgi:hypothetical protein
VGSFLDYNKIEMMPMRKFFTLQFIINIIHPDQMFNQLSVNSELKDEFVYNAPDHCVENIMNFARSYRVVDCESTGKIEMILN